MLLTTTAANDIARKNTRACVQSVEEQTLMAEYIFDNAAPQAAQRFDSLGALYDGNTTRRFEAVGVTDGWQCLEVGGGGGTIARWLSRRVGAGGRVLVTDIDPSYLDQLQAGGLPNVEVLRHDVGRDPLPAGAFDLVHERLVLIHVRTRGEALRRMAAALKPGGWLIVEDFDPPFADRGWLITDPDLAALYRKMVAAQGQLMAGRGFEPGWGRNLYLRLRELGLEQVGMEGHLAIGAGESPNTRLDRANFEQVRAEAVAAGLISDDEIGQLLARLDDSELVVSSATMFTAWGRRPM